MCRNSREKERAVKSEESIAAQSLIVPKSKNIKPAEAAIKAEKAQASISNENKTKTLHSISSLDQPKHSATLFLIPPTQIENVEDADDTKDTYEEASDEISPPSADEMIEELNEAAVAATEAEPLNVAEQPDTVADANEEVIGEAPEDASDWVYWGNCTITHYCNCEICNGKWAYGPTASGSMPVAGQTVACGDLPIGTHILLNDHEYIVEDTGVNGLWLDVYCDSHEEALSRGMYSADVYYMS